jgi:hypothetical protein
MAHDYLERSALTPTILDVPDSDRQDRLDHAQDSEQTNESLAIMQHEDAVEAGLYQHEVPRNLQEYQQQLIEVGTIQPTDALDVRSSLEDVYRQQEITAARSEVARLRELRNELGNAAHDSLQAKEALYLEALHQHRDSQAQLLDAPQGAAENDNQRFWRVDREIELPDEEQQMLEDERRAFMMEFVRSIQDDFYDEHAYDVENIENQAQMRQLTAFTTFHALMQRSEQWIATGNPEKLQTSITLEVTHAENPQDPEDSAEYATGVRLVFEDDQTTFELSELSNQELMETAEETDEFLERYKNAGDDHELLDRYHVARVAA